MTPTAAAAQGRGVGRCLGCRICRMSPSEEAGTWVGTGTVGVKGVRPGLALPGAVGGLIGRAAAVAIWSAGAFKAAFGSFIAQILWSL